MNQQLCNDGKCGSIGWTEVILDEHVDDVED